ncbi:hypothetical protein ACFWP2_02065 [Kitasatospora sp. NPDC058444]|uniref:hypothetical protein n=1 Tax=Kitasatospora sp. NPDC058444 TaxID=3346504 RepID=UPI0036611E6E
MHVVARGDGPGVAELVLPGGESADPTTHDTAAHDATVHALAPRTLAPSDAVPRTLAPSDAVPHALAPYDPVAYDPTVRHPETASRASSRVNFCS